MSECTAENKVTFMGEQFILKNPAGLTAPTKKLAHTDTAVLKNVICVILGGIYHLQKRLQ